MPGVTSFLGTLSSLTFGLQFYYKLDDLTDSSGNSITLTNNGSVTFGAGKIGNCATFSGSNSLTSSLNDHFNAHLGSYSVALWVKTTSSGAIAGLISYGNWTGSPGGWEIRKSSDNKITSKFGSNTNHEVQNPSTSNDGNWHHVVAVYDRTANMSLYVDGSSVGTPTSITDVTDDMNATFFSFSMGSNVFNDFFTGSIDEAGGWNRAITTAEISTLYNGGAGKTYPFT